MMTITMFIIKYIANMVVTKLNHYLHVVSVNKINVYVYAYINLYIKQIFYQFLEGTSSRRNGFLGNELYEKRTRFL